jgi:urea transport system substrate-binding protein
MSFAEKYTVLKDENSSRLRGVYGQFDVVRKTPGLVAGDAWSKELEGSKDLIGDWVGKKCGNYNTKTNKCGGQGS